MNKILLQSVENIEPRFNRLEYSAVQFDNDIVGYHCSAMTDEGQALGSGCSAVKQTAQIIALSEMLERKLVAGLRGSSEGFDYLLDQFPSSCGFAFGFNQANTIQRAISEAIERWVWSKWIDDQHGLNRIDINSSKLTPLSRFFYHQFESVQFFYQKILVFQPPMGLIELQIGIVLGVSGNGIFPGSKVSFGSEDVWEHALVESWRHRLLTNSRSQGLIFDRIRFFAKNGSAALSQIPPYRGKPLPTPKLRMLKAKSVANINGFLVRALCDDFIGWHNGAVERFVY